MDKSREAKAKSQKPKLYLLVIMYVGHGYNPTWRASGYSSMSYRTAHVQHRNASRQSSHKISPFDFNSDSDHRITLTFDQPLRQVTVHACMLCCIAIQYSDLRFSKGKHVCFKAEVRYQSYRRWTKYSRETTAKTKSFRLLGHRIWLRYPTATHLVRARMTGFTSWL